MDLSFLKQVASEINVVLWTAPIIISFSFPLMFVMLEISKFFLDIFILCLFLPTSFSRSPSIFCSSIKSYCHITLLLTNLSCVHLECFKLIDRLHLFMGKTPQMKYYYTSLRMPSARFGSTYTKIRMPKIRRTDHTERVNLGKLIRSPSLRPL